MQGLMSRLVTVDRTNLRLGRAVTALLGIAAVVMFLTVGGTLFFVVALAYLFVNASATKSNPRDRLVGMARMTAVGTLFSIGALASLDSPGIVALFIGIATYAAGLAPAIGRDEGRRGLLLTLWLILAVILGQSESSPLTLAVAFAVGGSLAMLINGARLVLMPQSVRASDDVSDEATKPPLAEVVTGSIGRFALVRAIALVVAVLLGFWWFASFPLWIAITVLVVVKPDHDRALRRLPLAFLAQPAVLP